METDILKGEALAKMNDVLETNIVVGGKKMIGKIDRVLYSAALHGGLDPPEFHRRCDDAGPTLLAMKDENGSVWGGFTIRSWETGTNGFANSDGSFVYRLMLKGAIDVIVLKATPGHKEHVADFDRWGPTFGGGNHVHSFHNGPFQLGQPASQTGSRVNCDDDHGYEHCAEGRYAFTGGSKNGFRTMALEVYAVQLEGAYSDPTVLCNTTQPVALPSVEEKVVSPMWSQVEHLAKHPIPPAATSVEATEKVTADQQQEQRLAHQQQEQRLAKFVGGEDSLQRLRQHGQFDTTANLPANAVAQFASICKFYASGDFSSMVYEASEMMEGFLHKNLYIALGLLREDNFDEANEYINKYLDSIATNVLTPDPVLLLVQGLVTRNMGDDLNAQFLLSTFTADFSLQSKTWMLKKDLEAAAPHPAAEHLLVEAPKEHRASLALDDWLKLKEQTGAYSAAMDELMKMTGLESLKRESLKLFQLVKNEIKIPEISRLPLTLNFLFVGNPGTGKTTVARIFSILLQEIGVRKPQGSSSSTTASNPHQVQYTPEEVQRWLKKPKLMQQQASPPTNSPPPICVETTGTELIRMGDAKAKALFDSALGGVLFIDEAYDLDPKSNPVGASIVSELLDLAEKHRENISIILAGYKTEIEEKVLSYNSGLPSRFPRVFKFEDYTQEELTTILNKHVLSLEWKFADDSVLATAGRRASKGHGEKGFGNARNVRSLFELAYLRAMQRPDSSSRMLTVEDFLGPRPDLSRNADLQAALQELNRMQGLEGIKTAVESLLKLILANYDKELAGKPLINVPLNRLFLGNPGTGKTTVASIYAKILKHSGLLTNGDVEMTTASEFIGSHVGESQQKTKAILERSKGKTLIIDEAYNLDDQLYGKQALDTILEKVLGFPGEDIAVLLLGYEDRMLKMLSNQNEGLMRRFNPEYAFRLQDYSKNDLFAIIGKQCERDSLRISLEVKKLAVSMLEKERCKPNFGNAGAVNTLLAQAKQRMAARDPFSKAILASDFQPSDAPKDHPLAPLKKLYNADKIAEHFEQMIKIAEVAKAEGNQKAVEKLLGNYVFRGNPGTGKTTVARVMARVLNDIGLLSTDTCVETSALSLQGSYVGHSKDNVIARMKEARGGVLFIDEAYELKSPNQFIQEVVATLVQEMTLPKNEKTVVILAGYTEKMNDMLLHVNPGLRSRFEKFLDFPDWEPSHCTQFIVERCKQEGVELEAPAIEALEVAINKIKSRPNWGNARDTIKICEKLSQARMLRVHANPSGLKTITEADVQGVLSEILEQSPLPKTAKVPRRLPADPVRYAAPTDVDQPRFSLSQKQVQITRVAEPPEQELDETKIANADNSSDARDPGVPDAVWKELQDCLAKHKKLIEQRRKDIMTAEFLRKHGDDVQRREAEETLEKLQAKEAEEKRIQEKLRGICPAGYEWIPVPGGYRCGGGSHYMSAEQASSK